MKRILTLLLCIVLITGTQATLAYAAPEWPSNVSVEAEGAVLMDARSGAVIYGKKSAFRLLSGQHYQDHDLAGGSGELHHG